MRLFSGGLGGFVWKKFWLWIVESEGIGDFDVGEEGGGMRMREWWWRL